MNAGRRSLSTCRLRKLRRCEILDSVSSWTAGDYHDIDQVVSSHNELSPLLSTPRNTTPVLEVPAALQDVRFMIVYFDIFWIRLSLVLNGLNATANAQLITSNYVIPSNGIANANE